MSFFRVGARVSREWSTAERRTATRVDEAARAREIHAAHAEPAPALAASEREVEELAATDRRIHDRCLAEPVDPAVLPARFCEGRALASARKGGAVDLEQPAEPRERRAVYAGARQRRPEREGDRIEDR